MSRTTEARFLPFSLAVMLCYPVFFYLGKLTSFAPAPMHFLRTLTSFPLLLFVPGAFWFLACSRRKEIGLLEFILANAGISVALLIGLTTILKLAGLAVTRANLLALIAASFLCGYAAWRIRDAQPAIRDDLSPRWPSMILLAAALVALYACFNHYLGWGQDRHWIAVGNPINPIDPLQQLTDWKFPQPGEIADARLTPIGGVDEIGKRRFKAHDNVAEFSIKNGSPLPSPYTLIFFFQSDGPLAVSARQNGSLLDNRRINKMIDVRCEYLIPQYYRLAWKRRIELAPGDNRLRFDLSPDPGMKLPNLVMDDFSNLTKPQFLQSAQEKYLFGEIGEFYDNIEVIDFSRHFFRKIFTYTDDLRPGVPGYTIVVPPLDFHVKMFFLALGDNSLHDIHRLYMGRLAFLYLISLSFIAAGGRKPAFRFTVLPIFVILTEAINMANYRLAVGNDEMLCAWFLLAVYFLLNRNTGLFMLFAVFTCLTRNHGFLFMLFALFSYGVYYGDWRNARRLLGCLLALLGIYVCSVLLIGYSTGVLKTFWLQDFLDENYRFRFGPYGGIAKTAGGCMLFTGWVALTSCFQFIALPFKKDRISKVLLLVIVFYYPLICLAKFYKPYYLIMIAYPISIAAARIMSQLPAAYFQLRIGKTRLLRFDFSNILFISMLILGAASIAALCVSPLIYPAFTTRFPSLYFRMLSKAP